jgi:hypothetical protein
MTELALFLDGSGRSDLGVCKAVGGGSRGAGRVRLYGVFP